jgi:hypothetical protein
MRKAITACICALVLGLGAGAGFAANPGTQGQPNQSCEEQPSSPAGFDTGGFEFATTVYAGAGAPSLNATSDKAVSQYDVACFQVSQR